MEARDAHYQKQITKMKEEEEKMKRTIQEYQENLQELRARGSEQSEVLFMSVQEESSSYYLCLATAGLAARSA